MAAGSENEDGPVVAEAAPGATESIPAGGTPRWRIALLLLVAALLGAIAVPAVRERAFTWCKDAIGWKPAPIPRGVSPEYAGRVNGLINQLGESSTRVKAREELEAMGRGILPVIAARMQSDAEAIRFELTTLLGHFEDPRGMALLASTAIEDDNARVREHAQWALTRFEVPDFAIAQLRSILTSGVAEVRFRAASTLAELGAADGLEILHQALYDSDRALSAVKALVSVSDETTSGVLVKAFPGLMAGERQEAIHAFRKIADPLSVNALIFALQDEDSGVRWRACHALRFVGDNSAIAPLEKLVEVEEDGKVLKHAAKALEKLVAKRERRSR